MESMDGAYAAIAEAARAGSHEVLVNDQRFVFMRKICYGQPHGSY
jgi:hypothetical protein